MSDRNWTCAIFHDVDLLPEDDRNIYSCPEQPRYVPCNAALIADSAEAEFNSMAFGMNNAESALFTLTMSSFYQFLYDFQAYVCGSGQVQISTPLQDAFWRGFCHKIRSVQVLATNYH